jgi:hypothetical protein
MFNRQPFRPDAIASQGLTTEWVVFTMPWGGDAPPQPAQIEDYLQQQYGEPLRWAITQISNAGLNIEAVVLNDLAV